MAPELSVTRDRKVKNCEIDSTRDDVRVHVVHVLNVIWMADKDGGSWRENLDCGQVDERRRGSRC